MREYREGAAVFPYPGPDGSIVFPSVENIIASTPVPPVFGQRFDKLYACTTHGEFGLKPDGTPEFADPDTYVEGPNGEKLFRI